jgi:TldD protein
VEQDIVSFAVDEARKAGCEYGEARYHRTADVTCLVRNSEPEPATMLDAEGIGIRVLCDGALGFAATNRVSNDSVRELVSSLVKRTKSASLVLREKIHFSSESASKEKWKADESKKVEDVSVSSIIELLKEVDSSLRNPVSGVSFPNRMMYCGWDVEEKYYENSDGSSLESRVPRVAFFCLLTSIYDGKPRTISVPPGFSQLGGTGGWEIIEDLNLTQQIPDRAKEITTAIKATDKAPAGETLDVILGPNVAGITSHESCGHPGEADRILGREGAQAGESFLKPEKLGMRIGSQEAFVSDDPTIPHSMGFYKYDDEGVKARKRKLIDAGVFSEFLQNRATAFVFNVKSNGSSRAVQFDREPIIRMGNTFIEPGDWTFEEMLKETKRGIYIKSYMEWNIDDKRLNQRYGGLEAWMIENGDLKNPVRDPIFEITTPTYWGSIEARAKDLEFFCGTCGKGDPMQGAPVFVGAPHVLLKGIRIGSR